VRVPTDTIRHRVQAYLHPSWAAAVPQLLRAKGVRGFYAGFTPTVIRDVPELVLQFTIYEGLRRVVQRFNGGAQLDTGFHLLLGGTAGAVSAVFSTPLDVRSSLGLALTLLIPCTAACFSCSFRRSHFQCLALSMHHCP
jgi:solute carrier family 25 (mitochondrial S-adenosylmethionine transporter), member 26